MLVVEHVAAEILRQQRWNAHAVRQHSGLLHWFAAMLGRPGHGRAGR